ILQLKNRDAGFTKPPMYWTNYQRAYSQAQSHFYRAETERDARSAYQRFQDRYQAKYAIAVENLKKDEASLFTFYHYPAEHWQHIRSTNVIESAFSTVRLRTAKTRGQGTMVTTLSMVFKLAERAQLRWQRLRGHQLITKVFEGVKFINGIEETLAA
ncbi:MAG: hypothetical protein HKK66_11230, partial [Chlorobiaceae bacterium]|nr:hypothetical protein [Chlorobiaceae bacterium]